MFHFDALFGKPDQVKSSSERDDVLHWDESFSVGNALIDGEHQEIIDILNRLWRDWSHDAHRLNVGQELETLRLTIEAHFANEEEVLARHRCPRLAEHQREHQRLQDELDAIAASYGRTDSRLLEGRMVRFMRDLIVGHVLGWDIDMKEYLHS
jgi:hemerythrin